MKVIVACIKNKTNLQSSYPRRRVPSAKEQHNSLFLWTPAFAGLTALKRVCHILNANYYITIIALLFLITSGQAFAQTAIGEELANAYYKSCNAKHDPRMTLQSQDAMCACTSVMMMKYMSVEDVKTMGGDTQEARSALNKMLIDVYAPCMSYPVEDLVGAECMDDKKIDELDMKKSRAEICGCMAERTAAWFIEGGRDLMRIIIKKNPNIYDPIEPVMSSREFKSQSYKSMISCLKSKD